MVNLMVVEGYVNAEPEIIKNPNDESKFIVKFRIATLNGSTSEKAAKYIWLNVVCFSGNNQMDYLKNNVHKDDYVTCIGQYSLMRVKKNYYPQMILERIDRKFAKGEVPHIEIVEAGEDADIKKEMNW
jgi:hypothetical protein